MAVATGLDGNSRRRLIAQVRRHDGGGTAQERERTHQHALIADRHQLRYAGAVARSENRHRVAIRRTEQVGMLLARSLLAQTHALVVAGGKRTGLCLGHRDPSRELADSSREGATSMRANSESRSPRLTAFHDPSNKGVACPASNKEM